MDTEQYIVAVKRECRQQAPSDWRQRVRRLPEVTIVGSGDMPRLLVEVSPRGLEQLRQAVGPYCHIEKVIMHHPSVLPR